MSAVTLRTFFENNAKKRLSSDRKEHIFSQIKQRTVLSSPLSMIRYQWYSKTIVVALLVFAVMSVLYDPSISKLVTPSSDIVSAPLGKYAFAGYIGDVLQVQGTIELVRNGSVVDTSQLKGGDVVHLYNTSTMTLSLKDGSHITVEGPAQFTVADKNEQGLLLSINHARYVSLDKPSSQDTSITQLTIETTNSRIVAQPHNNVHLALVTTQDRQFIQNKGDALTIETIAPQQEHSLFKTLAYDHVADVTSDIKVYNQVAAIYEELKNKSTSQIYELELSEGGDVRSLLAINDQSIIATNNPTKSSSFSTRPKQGTNDITDQSKIVVTGSSVSDSQGSDTGVVLIALQNETESMPMAAMMKTSSVSSNTMNSRSLFEEEGSDISKNDLKIATMVLDDQQSSNSKGGVSGEKQKITSSIQHPLNSHQLSFIATLLQKKCVSQQDIEQLNSLFNDSQSNLMLLLESINRVYYLDSSLIASFTSLTGCEDESNK